MISTPLLCSCLLSLILWLLFSSQQAFIGGPGYRTKFYWLLSLKRVSLCVQFLIIFSPPPLSSTFANNQLIGSPGLESLSIDATIKKGAWARKLSHHVHFLWRKSAFQNCTAIVWGNLETSISEFGPLKLDLSEKKPEIYLHQPCMTWKYYIV